MQKITYYCDKCGNEITELRCECMVRTVSEEAEWPSNNFDLCDDCRKKLVDWMKLELKPKKKAGRPKAIDRGKVIALWQAGWDTAKIADELKTSLERVNEVIKGLPINQEKGDES